APVAQGIEQRPPEPCAQVRILSGALAAQQPKPLLTCNNTDRTTPTGVSLKLTDSSQGLAFTEQTRNNGRQPGVAGSGRIRTGTLADLPCGAPQSADLRPQHD